MEAVVFLFILDKFNSSLPSTPFQLFIIILSCNNQIVFLNDKDQYPLAPKPSKILYTLIHSRIKRREGAASKGRERERERREGLLVNLGGGKGRERGRGSGRGERGLLVARVTGGDKFFYLQYLFLNRFGSVRVNRFLHYKTENRTEPRFFLTILIGFFSRFGFFSFFRFYRFIRFSGFFAHP
jgi:hypothetical protein